MATREYIGARYVPKFYTNSIDGSAQWQNNVVYEPLTYVTLINGHIYLSKKQVPATIGTPADNTEYWLDIGSYNAISEELQAQIDEINNELKRVYSEPKNIILVGDSWATGEYSDHGWAYYLENLLTDADNVYTAIRNGAGFVGYSGIKYKDVMQAMAAQVSDPSSVDLVLVAGGLNDAPVADATLEAGIIDFVNYVDVTYPNAKIISVAVNNELGYTNAASMVKSYLKVYAGVQGYKNKYYFVDKTMCAPFADFVNNNHLNDHGCEVVANTLYGVIYGYDYDFGFSQFQGTTFTNTTMTGSALSITVTGREYKDSVVLNFGSIDIGNFTPSGFLTNAKFTAPANSQMFPYNGAAFTNVALASANVGNGNIVTFPVYIQMTGPRELNLAILNFGRGSVNYSQLYIFDTTLIIPKTAF